MAVGPDGRTLAGLCGPNRGFQAGGMQLIVWDLPSGAERLRIPAPELGGGWITPGGGSLRFSRDSERIAFAGLVADGGPHGGFHRVVVEWDASTGRSAVVRDEAVAVSRHYVMHESEPVVPPMGLDDLRVEFGADNRAVLQMTHGDAIDTPWRARSPSKNQVARRLDGHCRRETSARAEYSRRTDGFVPSCRAFCPRRGRFRHCRYGTRLPAGDSGS